MNQPKLAFFHAPLMDRLSYPADCPFKTQRVGLTRNRLRYLGLLHGPGRMEIEPAAATLEQLREYHSPAYLEELRRASDGELTVAGFEMGLAGPDTPAFPDLFAYGALACGSALAAADLLLAGEVRTAFSLAGGFHHAMAEKASGFCYLNDAVLACMRLARAGKRVLYLDIDAHHGDGVQEAFYRRSDVLTISLHESGTTLFPWGGFENEIGEGDGRGFNVNVPLPAWTYDQAFLTAFEEIAVPLALAYQPDVVVLELGMDTLAGDPLTHLQMTNNAVVDVLGHVLGLGKPLLVLGGGGYHVENTVRAWCLAWRTCCGDNDDETSAFAIGGMMLGSSEWAGGLRDREAPVSPDQRQAVGGPLAAAIQRVKHGIFPHHGLTVEAPASVI
ncbi:MAG: acetoin utilization protein AcuC [Verrucomicrobiota bacterium]